MAVVTVYPGHTRRIEGVRKEQGEKPDGSFFPIAFEHHSFLAPGRIGGACQSLRFNMYVQLFAGRNFVGIV
jgi:hypothetical protein